MREPQFLEKLVSVIDPAANCPLTRREFVTVLIVAGAAPACLALRDPGIDPTSGAAPSRAVPVVSFHNDVPYLDYTGTAQPYLPPRGLRSAHAAAQWDEATLRSCACYA